MKVSNYEIMKWRMADKFTEYDQNIMINKFNLKSDEVYLYITFFGIEYRINKTTGIAEWSKDNFITAIEAGYNDAMTIYDVLCDSKPNCCICGEFVNMSSLSPIQGGSVSVGSGLFDRKAKGFENKTKQLAEACTKLGGMPEKGGDVCYKFKLFEFLPIIFQFWDADDEFPAQIVILWDKNILDFMRFETTWFAVSHIIVLITNVMNKENGVSL